MRTIKFWVCLLVILLGLWALPYFIPLQPYIAEAEKQASAAIGAPVVITQANLALLPSLRLNVAQLSIGEPQAVVIKQLTIKPHLMTLFAAPREVDIEAEAVTLTSAAITAYPLVMQQLQSNTQVGQAPVWVDKVTINQLDVRDVAGLPTFKMEARLVENHLNQLNLVDQQNTLTLALTPQGELQQLNVDLNNFVWAKYPNITVQQGHIAGVLSGEKLTINTLELGLLGGQVTGRGALLWQPKTLLDGQFQFQQLAMEQLVRDVTGKPPRMYLSGKLSGQGVVHGAARDIGDLSEHVGVQGEANITRGVLHGIDLSQVTKMLLKQDTQAGDTQFDTLKTDFKKQGARIDFKQLVMQSGLLHATGQVALINDTLDGEVTVAVKHTAGALEVPLDISGPMTDPTVLPTKAAMVGAAVGTAILPGVGTGLGLKAGSQLKQWFGGK